MLLPITTAVLIGTTVLLSIICFKLLAVLVGALILYFCPLIAIFLILAGVVYFRFTRRGKARARRLATTFGDRGPK